MTKNPFKFVISRRTVILFWIIVLTILFVIAFFAPSVFYRVTQMPYQKTPYVNTPGSAGS